jgi:hypothetical protein
MTHRILAASIILLCSGLAVPISAAPMGRSAHPPALVKPGQPIPIPPTSRAFVRSFRERSDALRPFGRRSFAGFPWWGYGSYGPADFPSDYAPEQEPLTYPYPYPYPYPPYENFSERSRPPVFYQPGCRTDTQTVPSESGGERTIHITRCY